MKTSSRTFLAGSALVAAAIIAASGHSAPGTLSPPPGAISGTGVSLEEIDQKIQTLELSLTKIQDSFLTSNGPWEVFHTPAQIPSDGLVEVTNSPILLHSIIVNGATVELYSGNMPGIKIADVIYAVGGSTNNGAYECQSLQKDFNVVLQDGLYITWINSSFCISSITILYRTLE